MTNEISINFYLFDSENNSDSDLICKVDKNDFIQTAITSYDREDMKNNTLWKQFKKNFAE
jgi:hypothetical protein